MDKDWVFKIPLIYMAKRLQTGESQSQVLAMNNNTFEKLTEENSASFKFALRTVRSVFNLRHFFAKSRMDNGICKVQKDILCIG